MAAIKPLQTQCNVITNDKTSVVNNNNNQYLGHPINLDALTKVKIKINPKNLLIFATLTISNKTSYNKIKM